MSTTPATEPVAVTEAIRTLILAVMALSTAFDVWEPTPQQTGAVLGCVIAVSVLLSVFARLRSTPTANVALTVADAEALAAANPKPPEFP